MTVLEIITPKGFVFSGACTLCGGKYSIYRNPNYSDVELKVNRAGTHAKIYKGGKQVAISGSQSLEQALSNVGIS